MGEESVARVRAVTAEDRDAVVALSLRAWEPVFASLEGVLGGSGVFARMHPDWRADQRRSVERVLGSDDFHVWVAEACGAVAGFTAVRLDPAESMGEIYMLAVDPEHQRGGVGSALTSFALEWIRDSGMTMAMVETGGDPGHAAARRTYERAGFALLPIARYFKNL